MSKQVQLKLKDLYQESQKDQDQAEQQLVLEQGELQLKSDLLATEQALLKAKAKLDKTLRMTPFNPSAIVAAKNEVRELEAGIVDLKELKKLF